MAAFGPIGEWNSRATRYTQVKCMHRQTCTKGRTDCERTNGSERNKRKIFSKGRSLVGRARFKSTTILFEKIMTGMDAFLSERSIKYIRGTIKLRNSDNIESDAMNG